LAKSSLLPSTSNNLGSKHSRMKSRHLLSNSGTHEFFAFNKLCMVFSVGPTPSSQY